MDLNEINNKNKNKSDWKKLVKIRILNKINKESYIKNKTMKKVEIYKKKSKFDKNIVSKEKISIRYLKY